MARVKGQSRNETGNWLGFDRGRNESSSFSSQAFVAVSRKRLQERHEQITRNKNFAVRSKVAVSGGDVEELFPVVTGKKKKKKEREGSPGK